MKFRSLVLIIGILIIGLVISHFKTMAPTVGSTESSVESSRPSQESAASLSPSLSLKNSSVQETVIYSEIEQQHLKILSEVRSLGLNDQRKLDEISAKESQLIQGHEQAYGHYLNQHIESLITSTLDEGFFVIGVWTETAQNPFLILQALLENPPEGESHHYDLLVSNAMSELNDRWNKSPPQMSDAQASILIALLSKKLSETSQPDLAAKMSQLLVNLDQQPLVISILKQKDKILRQRVLSRIHFR